MLPPMLTGPIIDVGNIIEHKTIYGLFGSPGFYLKPV
jgi:hypothetical protein